jgi:glutamate-ammonia-ligase adenylyltransferase
VTVQYKKLFNLSADPVAAENRFERLLEDQTIRNFISSCPEQVVRDILASISISRFLFHFLCRQPETIEQFAGPLVTVQDVSAVHTLDQLRIYKYRELLNITRMDLSGKIEYGQVLAALSRLADYAVNRTFSLALSRPDREVFEKYFCTFALGKLGAYELNFSSDIDLIFVCANPADVPLEVHHFQKILQDGIRLMSNQLETRTAEGFLYRVDLKLRPWGKSGPLVMSIDETENYYAASTEAWERFAWLRARIVSGSVALGNDMYARLQPFVYKRSLSSEDLDRFIEIKNDMFKARRKKGYWNVKVGEGGIRDLEFFIQMLQLVNAASHPALQVTGTMNVLSGLQTAGLISELEAHEVRHSYMFLRRLENRLQMIDEQQTHELPDDPALRIVIARSIGIAGQSNNEILDNFEGELFANRTLAQGYFERILPQKNP